MTDNLLKELVSEVKGLREDLQGLREDIKKVNIDTCEPDEALLILGLNSRRYLAYFTKQGELNRRKGGKSFVYFKSECTALAEKIRTKTIVVPPVRQLFLYND